MRSKETRQELLRHAVRQVPVLLLGQVASGFLRFVPSKWTCALQQAPCAWSNLSSG